MVEQQKTGVAEESTTKTNIKEKIDEGDILETEKGKDQDNASGQEEEDLEG